MSVEKRTPWPAYYSAADIATTEMVRAWMAEAKKTRSWLRAKTGYSWSTVSNVLNGCYASSPALVLNAIAQAIEAEKARRPVQPRPAVAPKVAKPVVHEGGNQQRILKLLDKHDGANPMSVGDLVARIGGDESETWRSLEALIAACKVISAVITRDGLAEQVVYPMGRVPKPKPGPKAGSAPRGRAISVPPSNSAKSIHRGASA
ncbi:MAG: hypothetical protein JSS57_00220 [Proteobacteria bacterium]|nr:hypothetical protein [Pseudomonadota bacterium]